MKTELGKAWERYADQVEGVTTRDRMAFYAGVGACMSMVVGELSFITCEKLEAEIKAFMSDPAATIRDRDDSG